MTVQCKDCKAINCELEEGLCIECWSKRARINGKAAYSYMGVLLLTLLALGFFTFMNIINASACWDMAKAQDKVHDELFLMRGDVWHTRGALDEALGRLRERDWGRPTPYTWNTSDEDMNLCYFKGLIWDVSDRALAVGEDGPTLTAKADYRLLETAHKIKRKWIDWGYKYPKPKEDLDK